MDRSSKVLIKERWMSMVANTRRYLYRSRSTAQVMAREDVVEKRVESPGRFHY